MVCSHCTPNYAPRSFRACPSTHIKLAITTPRAHLPRRRPRAGRACSNRYSISMSNAAQSGWAPKHHRRDPRSPVITKLLTHLHLPACAPPGTPARRVDLFQAAWPRAAPTPRPAGPLVLSLRKRPDAPRDSTASSTSSPEPRLLWSPRSDARCRESAPSPCTRSRRPAWRDGKPGRHV